MALQVTIWNERLLLQRLCDAVEQLAQYGAAKPEQERGLDDVSLHLPFGAASVA